MSKDGQKPRKRRNLAVEFIVITLSIIIACFIIVFAVFSFVIGDINKESITSEDTGAVELSDEYSGKKIKNIALFGTDSRENVDGGRSDAIMIASINTENGKIKLISIARDTYVNVPDKGNTKICHAYAYGGSSLAVKTINTNFGLDITDFVSVNFDQLTEIVDILGGIDVEISDSELQEFNKIIRETSNETLTESGLVHLDGAQALCYSRIRKNDSDDARTSRQRELLEILFNKMMNESPIKYPSIIKKLMPYVTTSLNTEEIIKLAAVVVTKNPTFESGAIPNEFIEHSGGKIDGVWYYIYDIDTAADMIKSYIYKDIPFSQFVADTSTNSKSQVKFDTYTDTEADTETEADISPDTITDTDSDTAADTTPDEITDVDADVVEDTGSDTITNVDEDSAEDTGSDTITDVDEDSAKDTGSDSITDADEGFVGNIGSEKDAGIETDVISDSEANSDVHNDTVEENKANTDTDF